jgi:tetratricopeptide (TPR) repeat protein
MIKPYNKRLMAIGVLLFITVAVYASSLGNEFVWDDRGYILDTPELRHPANIGLIFDPELYFARFQEGSWRPLVTLSHFLTVGAFGYRASGHNAFDLALYAAVVMLVFITALRLGVDERAAFLASALFAVHPVHVEPVMVSALRADLLCALFMLLAFLCIIKADEEGPGRKGFWALSLGLFALGLLSKEVALVFPLLVVAYDLARAKRGRVQKSPSELAKRYGLLLAVTGAYGVLRFGPFVGPPRSATYIGGTLAGAVLSTLGIFAQYLRLLFFPLRLNADYVVKPVTSLTELQTLMGLIALGALLAAAVAFYRRKPIVAFGLAWLMFTLLPVSNLVPLDNPMTERYLFIPSIGFCWAVGLLGSEAFERVGSPASKAALWTVVVGLVLAFGLRAYTRTKDWRDGVTLWQATVEASPDSYRAHLNLGSAFLLRGKWERGREETERALALKPDSAEAFHNLGLIETNEGNWPEAEAAYRRSLGLQADAPPTLYNLANALAYQGKTEEALAFLQQAIARKPLFAEAYLLKGNLLSGRGEVEEAVAAYKKALSSEPETSYQAHINLGNVERGLGNLEAAEVAYRSAIDIAPGSAKAHFNLASLYGQQGRYRETIIELERALATDPSMTVAHKNLGLLYLKVQRNTARARYHLNKVLELAPNHPEAPAIRSLIESLPPS